MSGISIGKSLIVGSLIFCCSLFSNADEPKKEKPIVLGLGWQGFESKHDVEFQKYGRMQPVFKEHNIKNALFDLRDFYNRDMSVDQIYKQLKEFQVVHIQTTEEGIGTDLTDVYKKRAENLTKALERYLNDGGSVLIQPFAERYQGHVDEEFWNIVLKPFGAKILHEGVFDKSRKFIGTTRAEGTVFWYTNNIRKHPVTEGVKSLSLPLTGFGHFPGLVAMEYSPDWQVLVFGEKEAKSYQTSNSNRLDINIEATYKEAPPVLAVRNYGKGRIVCYPLTKLYTGLNHRNPIWTDIVEVNGDVKVGRTSDSMKMQMNAYEWLAETGRQNSELGTHKFEKYKPVTFPQTVDWDKTHFGTPNEGLKGIFGAHSSYTDGKSTVAEYAKTAEAAGASFIVFTDPLELLTPEKLEKLKKDCADVTAKSLNFYACPGVEFTDGIGVRRALWADRVVFPRKEFQQGSVKRVYPQWTGEKVLHFGEYSMQNGFAPNAVIDYKQYRAAGAHPENQWWYWQYFIKSYDGDKLIADNYDEWLAGLRDMRWSNPCSFTRIKSADEVKSALDRCYTSFNSIEAAKKTLNTHGGGAYWAASGANQYVSQGPQVLLWDVINRQMESHWKYTRGAQRVRAKFVVKSPAGIKEVKVHDANQGLLRHFLGNGKTELSKEFEITHDKQHYLTLEVTDNNGKKAYSHFILIFCYKQGLFRCGDNLNTLGSAGLVWIPDRNGALPMGKSILNGAKFTLRGWDAASAICPMPFTRSMTEANFKGVGTYPKRYKENVNVSKILDVPLASYNIQIATQEMKNLAEAHSTETRPVPAMATPSRDVKENEYFEKFDMMVAPADRGDYYIMWNHRRALEGIKDYRGSFVWHEGWIKFKKDVTLTGSVPIPLMHMECPCDISKNWGTTFIVTDAGKGTRVAILMDKKKRVTTSGIIKNGGYAAVMPSLVGYRAFIPATYQSEFSYRSDLPGRLVIGLGREGQKIKAGTIMNYKFAVGFFADPVAGNALLEETVKAMNMNGGKHDGYPIEMKVGEVADTTFFFTAKAKDNEAVFKLGPQKLIIDLPIRVKGLLDNGCAAVYSKLNKKFRFVSVVDDTAWFQEPIERANEMWVGNIFVCDNPKVKITAVIDGQGKGKTPFIEVHNPTGEELKTKLRSPANTPVFGGLEAEITIPAGDSVKYSVIKKAIKKID
jgi:hypothetical protein